ncbi:response regulator [bacterium]|nr:response regulator [bacterium]
MNAPDESLALQRALIKHLVDSGIIETDEFRRELINVRKEMGLNEANDPLAFLEESAETKQPDIPFIPKQIKEKPLKVLIIDNVALIRNLIKNALAPRGNYIFIEGENGIEAVNLFKNEKPDLVLMDIEMEGMNGLDALREIRSVNKQTPVVMMTGNAKQDYVAQAVQFGMTDFISKPLNIERIMEVIQKFAIQ